MFLILLGFVFTFLFYGIFVRPTGYWKRKGVLCGNAIWVFGDFLGAITKSYTANDIVCPLYGKYKKERYFGICQYNTPILVVKDTELIKSITVRDFEYFLDHRTLVPEDVDPLIGKNVFLLKGTKWRDMRSVLTPAFTTNRLKSMLESMKEHAQSLVDFYLEKDLDVIEVDLKDTFTRYCSDVIMDITFGVRADSFREPNNEYYLMGMETANFSGLLNNLKLMGVMMIPQLYKLFGVRIFDSKLVHFYEKLINNIIQFREANGIVRNDLMQIFMKNLKNQTEDDDVDENLSDKEKILEKKNMAELSIDDMSSQAMLFVFSGIDSVTKLMCFAAYEMAMNPDIQSKLRDEIDSTFMECEGNLTYEALAEMKYLDAVVAETSRKWPGDFILDRSCSKPYTIDPINPGEKPLQINQGDTIWFPIYALHHDPDYFPHPEKFDPDRFSDENKSKINPYAYFPFGIGPRVCIGIRFAILECKVVLCYLLRNFEIIPSPKSCIPIQIRGNNLQYEFKRGFWFGLRKLQK